MDKHASSIVEPCLHRNCCAECIYKILQTSNKCPLCRTIVQHVLGEISHSTMETLEKAAKIAIVNYTIVTQGEALAIVHWRQFMAGINNDFIEGTKLQKVGEMMAFAWPQVLEKATQILNQNFIDFQDMVNNFQYLTL